MDLYSGKCKTATCGIKTKFLDIHGKECHTGDIVLLWSRFHEADEGFTSNHGLTAIVQDGYTTYSNGEIKIEGDQNPFVMGIHSTPLNEQRKWGVEIVKKYHDAIDGEHWQNYGFNYRATPPTERKD